MRNARCSARMSNGRAVVIRSRRQVVWRAGIAITAPAGRAGYDALRKRMRRIGLRPATNFRRSLRRAECCEFATGSRPLRGVESTVQQTPTSGSLSLGERAGVRVRIFFPRPIMLRAVENSICNVATRPQSSRPPCDRRPWPVFPDACARKCVATFRELFAANYLAFTKG
jgi:hypothetical protein